MVGGREGVRRQETNLHNVAHSEPCGITLEGSEGE